MISDKKLDHWIENKLNVLLVSKHGVGKSSKIIEAFNRNKLRYLYFSSPTLDPWVDVIGCPKEHIDKDGNKYLDLVRPKAFAFDEIEAIFFDEINRAPPKIRNAIMELLQFKSINGKKFNNLKFVWGAANPENKNDDNEYEYDVQRIDPAQKDRFHVIYDIPYKCDRGYFKKKYGEIGSFAVDWWDALTDKEKDSVSPRRLDYALEMFNNNGDIRDILPTIVSTSKLIKELTSGSFYSKIDVAFKNKDTETATEIVNDESTYQNVIKKIVKSKEMCDFYLPLIENKEKIIALATQDEYYENVVSVNALNNIFLDFADNNRSNELSIKLRKSGIGLSKIIDASSFNNVVNVLGKGDLDKDYLETFLESKKNVEDYDWFNVDTLERRAERVSKFHSPEGREIIYVNLVRFFMNEKQDANLLLNIIQGTVMLVDRSFDEFITNNYVAKFFASVLFSFYSLEKDNFKNELEKIRSVNLNRFDNFLSEVKKELLYINNYVQ